MPAPEPLILLLSELEAMAAGDREAVLGALTRKERQLLDQLGRNLATEGPTRTGISSWLAAHVHAARSGDSSMTPSSREALLRAVGTPASEPRRAGRPLAGAFGGLLAPRGAR